MKMGTSALRIGVRAVWTLAIVGGLVAYGLSGMEDAPAAVVRGSSAGANGMLRAEPVLAVVMGQSIGRADVVGENYRCVFSFPQLRTSAEMFVSPGVVQSDFERVFKSEKAQIEERLKASLLVALRIAVDAGELCYYKNMEDRLGLRLEARAEGWVVSISFTDFSDGIVASPFDTSSETISSRAAQYLGGREDRVYVFKEAVGKELLPYWLNENMVLWLAKQSNSCVGLKYFRFDYSASVLFRQLRTSDEVFLSPGGVRNDLEELFKSEKAQIEERLKASLLGALSAAQEKKELYRYDTMEERLRLSIDAIGDNWVVNISFTDVNNGSVVLGGETLVVKPAVELPEWLTQHMSAWLAKQGDVCEGLTLIAFKRELGVRRSDAAGCRGDRK